MLKVLAHCFSLGSLFVLSAAFGTAAYLMPAARDLPDYRLLAEWEPAGVARVYAGDGELVTEYARERRFPVPIQSVPEVVKQAFLSAEDKNFYSHPGLDPLGVLRAVAVNAVNLGSDQRLVGASTITQQVAKNFLLTSERSFARKAREAILSLRMEQAYSKDKILELYLNGIYLGAGAYGIEAAARTYFAKPLDRLSAGEAALLAALPKAPGNYNPYLDRQAAIGRRNWVLGQMAANGFISPEAAEREAAAPLETARQEPAYVLAASEYFAEEVRRTLLLRFGTDALYEAGYSVTTTLDPKLQAAARVALRRGLVSYDEARGYRGPVAKLDLAGNWRRALADVEPLADVDEWRLGVVLASDGAEARLALRAQPDETSAGEVATVALPDVKWALRGRGKPRSRVDQVLAPGDVVYVEKAGDGYRLRQPPKVQGALVSMDARTGKVLALVGGFSFAQSQFNRATQARRQPGSAFKPFVYAAALDAGYTPATLVMDAPFAMADGAGRVWRPKNYDGRFGGPSTLRTGLEKSRNLMTVRLARHLGMEVVAEYGKRFGIYDELAPYLPMALGAGETTLMRLVAAYAVIANGGKAVHPAMIERIEDRRGRVIGDRFATDGQPGSLPPAEPEQVLDPMTAYQITSMLRGVVERGTATNVGRLGVPVAGKTGTTNDEKDVWFVGFTPDIVTGVFIGYDVPAPMGYGESGGGLAAPVFVDFMRVALEGRPRNEFQPPEGMRLLAVDRRTGRRAPPGSPGTTMEAFKPGTAPCPDDCPVIDGDGQADVAGSTTDTIAVPAALREKLLASPGLY